MEFPLASSGDYYSISEEAVMSWVVEEMEGTSVFVVNEVSCWKSSDGIAVNTATQSGLQPSLEFEL